MASKFGIVISSQAKSLEVLFKSVVVILVVSLCADLFVVSQEDGMDQT